MSDQTIKAAAEALGIAPGYYDISGTRHEVPADMLVRLIDAMGRGAARPAEAAPAAGRCFLPEPIASGGRCWGLAVQLYGLASSRSWGIGDFGALRVLLALAAEAGAAAVQLNPLHALFPCFPDHISPYAPSSRLFLNPLYIDVEAEEDYRESKAVQATATSSDFQRRLRKLRESPLVDYEGVAKCKFEILERMFKHFRARHLDGGSSARAQEFQDFRSQMGEALQGFAVFEALCVNFKESHRLGWQSWPESYRDPRSGAVRRFASDHQESALFSMYLQWLAFRQLQAVSAYARAKGMAIGLIADISVGCDAVGFDAWWDQELNALDAEIGAPPDPFCIEGQTWGAPPWRPHVLGARGGAPLAELLDRAMAWAGGVRLDHVMGITRLFWVPRGAGARNGAYVAYPQEDLIGVIAEASNRHKCMVVGEDLGTVPEGFRERLTSAGILSTRILYFERGSDGPFHPPSAYPRLACCCAGTHDLPTLAGFLQGWDIAVDEAYGGEDPAAAHGERERAVAALRAVLVEEGLLKAEDSVEPGGIIAAVHGFLGRTRSALALARLEDVLTMSEQMNLPGAAENHQNWRRKFPVAVEDLPADGRLIDTAEAFRRSGR